MHNFQICDPVFDRPVGRKHRVLAALARLLGIKAELVPAHDPTTQMITPEQRINLWHLVEQVLAYRVPGDFVDLGCFDGRTSAFVAGILARHDPQRRLHLYDSFEHNLGLFCDTRQALLANFQARQLPDPIIHAGRFEVTLPGELPPVIAFAQIDCGVGGPPEFHAALIKRCLEHVWPRLAPGAVCVVQDYHDPASGSKAVDYYPFIKATVDEFLTPHGVSAVALFSGQYSHGFFRKPLGHAAP